MTYLFCQYLCHCSFYSFFFKDPCISTGEPEGTYPAYDEGNRLDVWMKRPDGTPSVGFVSKIYYWIRLIYCLFDEEFFFFIWSYFKQTGFLRGFHMQFSSQFYYTLCFESHSQ